MNTAERLEAASRLRGIKEEMLELLGEAEELIDMAGAFGEGGMGGERARLYWLAHIKNSIDSKYEVTLQDTIEELLKEE